MKKLPLVILIISIKFNCIAQQIDFTDTTNEWLVLSTSGYYTGNISAPDLTLYKYFYSGRKMLNGKEYQVINGQLQKASYMIVSGDTQTINIDSSIVHYYIRKDNSSKNIYILYSDTSTNELLLYHKEAYAGDSQKVLQGVGGLNILQVVDSVKMSSINGKNHLTYYFRCLNHISSYSSYMPYVYVDGLGSLSDPFLLTRLSSYHTYSSSQVICFKNRYGYLQTNDIKQNCQGKDIISAVQPKDTNQRTPSHRVYPQPAVSFVKIEVPDTLENGEVMLFNQQGQNVFHRKTTGSNSFRIDNPGNLHGLNYYRIVDNVNNKTYTGKLMFQ